MKEKVLNYLNNQINNQISYYENLNEFILYYFIKYKCEIVIKNYFKIKYKDQKLLIYVNENMNVYNIVNCIFAYLQNNNSKIKFIKNDIGQIQNLFCIENKIIQLEIPIIDILNLKIHCKKINLLNKDISFLNKQKLRKRDVVNKLLSYCFDDIDFFIDLYKQNFAFIKAHNKFFIFLLKKLLKNFILNTTLNKMVSFYTSINFLKTIRNKTFLNIYFDKAIDELDDLFFQKINSDYDIEFQYHNIKLLKKETFKKILTNINISFETKVKLTNLYNK